jgi:hypothetical protein
MSSLVDYGLQLICGGIEAKMYTTTVQLGSVILTVVRSSKPKEDNKDWLEPIKKRKGGK